MYINLPCVRISWGYFIVICIKFKTAVWQILSVGVIMLQAGAGRRRGGALSTACGASPAARRGPSHRTFLTFVQSLRVLANSIQGSRS